MCHVRHYYEEEDRQVGGKVDADFFFVGVTVAQANQMLEDTHNFSEATKSKYGLHEQASDNIYTWYYGVPVYSPNLPFSFARDWGL
jgi:hypothetical protein